MRRTRMPSRSGPMEFPIDIIYTIPMCRYTWLNQLTSAIRYSKLGVLSVCVFMLGDLCIKDDFSGYTMMSPVYIALQLEFIPGVKFIIDHCGSTNKFKEYCEDYYPEFALF